MIFWPIGCSLKSASTMLLAIRRIIARTARGAGTRKMLAWPRKQTTPMYVQREKKRDSVRRIPAPERGLDL